MRKMLKMNVFVKLLIYCEIRAFVNGDANVKKHNLATYGRLTIGLSLEVVGFKAEKCCFVPRKR